MPDIITSTTTTTMIATTTVLPSFDSLAFTLTDTFVRYLNYLDRIPGGQIILRYIKSSYKDDPVRSLFELALVIFAVHYFLLSKKKENKSEVVKFSKREIDELVDEWEPTSLVEPVSDLENWELKCVPIVEGANGGHISLNSTPTLNLASNDFLGLNENDSIKEAAKSVIHSVGVGACGPPNFYGSQDVHVRLEEDLAAFMETEQAILYGQDFVTAPSVITAFFKRGDLIVADSSVNLAIQKALIVSRCDIEWYDHNDMEHLEEILSELKPVLDKQKPIRRRCIVTEGLFANTGDVVDLPKLVELKNKYKYRLFIDETFSVGVLGKNGKGVTEHFGIPRSEVSITIGSMANAFASSGGFCVGVQPMIQHQRISSNAYVFSASLPPYSARVVSQAIKQIETSNIVGELSEKVSLIYNGLKNSNMKYFKLVSSPVSPIIHLSLIPSYRKSLGLPSYYGTLEVLNTGKAPRHINNFDTSFNLESFILQLIIDKVLEKSQILITRSKLVVKHEYLPIESPHLLIKINNSASKAELKSLLEVLPVAITDVCSTITNESDLVALESKLQKY